MKTLYLLRHAKSSWKDESLPDQARPLKKKGHFQADKLSDHLSALIPPPQRVLCSPAVRTRQTLDYFLEVWPLPAKAVVFSDALYMTEVDSLLGQIQSLPDSIEIALMAGHNPGLTDLAGFLLDAKVDYVKSIRPCGFLQVDFEVNSWKEVAELEGKLKLNLRPKDLQK
ncbi:MAG: histidine phosphatase family protein [Kiritimatiellae bacterium]|jgi:phosphohistidine phosphatase|nr:histidine phosphatase family protein [Kiritimatiellia bacterium]